MVNSSSDYVRFKIVEAKLKERGFTIVAHGDGREVGRKLPLHEVFCLDNEDEEEEL